MTIGMTELRQSARFLEETLQAPVVVLLHRRGSGNDGAAGFARRQIRRHELLDRHLPVEALVMGQICNAKSAVPEDLLDTVLV
jgi:hypothetical protein